MCTIYRAPEKRTIFEGKNITHLSYVQLNHILHYLTITMHRTIQSLHTLRSSSSKYTNHPVKTIMNNPRPRPPTQYHLPLTTSKKTSTTSFQNMPISHSSSNLLQALERSTPTTYYISFPRSTHNLVQTHIQQIHSPLQPPKHTTYIYHTTIPLKLIHLHYLRNALHTPFPSRS